MSKSKQSTLAPISKLVVPVSVPQSDKPISADAQDKLVTPVTPVPKDKTSGRFNVSLFQSAFKAHQFEQLVDYSLLTSKHISLSAGIEKSIANGNKIQEVELRQQLHDLETSDLYIKIVTEANKAFFDTLSSVDIELINLYNDRLNVGFHELWQASCYAKPVKSLIKKLTSHIGRLTAQSEYFNPRFVAPITTFSIGATAMKSVDEVFFALAVKGFTPNGKLSSLPEKGFMRQVSRYLTLTIATSSAFIDQKSMNDPEPITIPSDYKYGKSLKIEEKEIPLTDAQSTVVQDSVPTPSPEETKPEETTAVA